ncbi:MAG: malonyl-ACP O-methyltransferase BioC [Culturomica sp.]|nr:malonyl-ACP O-methyltransferase BioC [Culturomica sp.]
MIDKTLNKNRIKQRFNRSAGSYDEHAHVQRRVVQRLRELLSGYLSGEAFNVLEAGCGTGLLTRELKRWPAVKELWVNDLSEELCTRTADMLDIPASHVVPGDIETVELPAGLDLIASSSVFQWLSAPGETIARLVSRLVPGGWLVFSTFGIHNLQEIRELTGEGLDYPDRSTMRRLLEAGTEILHAEEEEIRLRFSDPVDVLKHLKRTGVNNSESNKLRTPSALRRFAEAYRFRYADHDGSCCLTYHPVYYICRKPACFS